MPKKHSFSDDELVPLTEMYSETEGFCQDNRVSDSTTIGNPDASLRAPDGGWGWLVILAAHSTLIFREGIAKCLGVFLPTFRKVFHVDTSLIGLVSSLCVTTADFTGLISGPSCRKFGCRPVAIVGGLLAGLGLIAASFSHELVQLGFGLCVSGFGLGLSLTPSLTMVSRYFDKRYTLANGLAYAGSGVGILVLAPLAQVLIDTYGWQGALLIIGGLCFNVSVCGALLRPLDSRPDDDHRKVCPQKTTNDSMDESHEEYPETSDPSGKDCVNQDRTNGESSLSRSGLSKGQAEKLSPQKEIEHSSPFSRFVFFLGLSIFKDICTVIVMVVQFCGRFSYMGWLIYLIPHAEEKGIAPLDATFIASIAGVSNIISRSGHGFLVDCHLITAQQLLLIASFVAALPLLLDPVSSSYGALMAGSLMYGLASGAYFPLCVVVLNEFVDQERFPNALGWSYAFGGIGRLSAGYLTGYFFTQYENYNISFIVLGSVQEFASVILVINIIICWFRKKKATRDKSL